MLSPTPAQAARGWVLRDSTMQWKNGLPLLSDPILVRGSRDGDGYCERKSGFVYAVTPDEADEYDRQHGYAS